MRGFFVTGTGTGVGKTVVSAALIGALRHRGIRACGMKPVESGYEGEAGSDAAMLRDASETAEPMEAIAPFTFRAPVAPLAAARLEERRVEPSEIVESVRKLARRHEALVVEGAGGLLVPIAGSGYMIRDLARDLALPVIIVTTPYLGTVNHTLLTLEALDRAGLSAAGIVINRTDAAAAGARDESGRDLIKELSGVPILGDMPFIEGLETHRIIEAGISCLDLETLTGCL